MTFFLCVLTFLALVTEMETPAGTDPKVVIYTLIFKTILPLGFGTLATLSYLS